MNYKFTLEDEILFNSRIICCQYNSLITELKNKNLLESPDSRNVILKYQDRFDKSFNRIYELTSGDIREQIDFFKSNGEDIIEVICSTNGEVYVDQKYKYFRDSGIQLTNKIDPRNPYGLSDYKGCGNEDISKARVFHYNVCDNYIMEVLDIDDKIDYHSY